MINPQDHFTFNGKPKGDDVWVGTWKVPRNLPYFDGHFPGNSILPGVGIIDGSLCAVELAGHTLVGIQMKKAKFSMIITPDVELCIEVAKLGESVRSHGVR